MESIIADQMLEVSAKMDAPPQTKPAYVPGEVLIKFKTGNSILKIKNSRAAMGIDLDKQVVNFADIDETTIPDSLKKVANKHKISKLEKVFKGAKSPKEELEKLKKLREENKSISLSKLKDNELLNIDFSKTYRLYIDSNTSPEDVLQELINQPDIEYVEPNYIITKDNEPNDPYYLDTYPTSVTNRVPNWNPPHDYQWNIKKTNSGSNWQTDVSNIAVAVIDTGVDINHPELGNVWTNENEIPGDGLDNDQNGYFDDVHGYNFGGAGEDVSDYDGHGTHVAGVISAKSNNVDGIAGVTGNARIMALKVFYDNGYANDNNIAAAIRYAVNNSARVINLSLGGTYSNVIKDSLDYATAANVISVVSAGNGNAYSPSHFPASYKPAITVGAVDEDLNKLKYADYGPNIDIAAPGGGKPCTFWDKPSYCSNILSLRSSLSTRDPSQTVGGQYLRDSGTSMAAPHVAGIIALLLAQYPDFTLQDVENYIRYNSTDPSGKGWTEKTGWGVISSNGIIFIPPTNLDFTIYDPVDNALTGKVITVAGTIKTDNFDHYEIAYRIQDSSAWLTDGVTLEANGKSQIIPPINTNSALAGTINLPENSPLGKYDIKTTLYMTNGQILTATKIVNYVQKQGTTWLTDGKKTKMLIADLNNDNNKEIILYNNYTGYDYGLYVYDNKYQLLWNVNLPGEAVVGDLDTRNPGKEIALQTKEAIFIYDSNGNQITDMTLNFSSDIGKNILVMDADNNSTNELYFHQSPTNQLHCFEQATNGQFMEKWSYAANGATFGHLWPIGGDIDGDGHQEIIVLNANNTIEALNYHGQRIAQLTISGSYKPDKMILVDMDLDNKEELVFHVQWGDTRMVKFNGSTFSQVWSYNNSNNAETLAAGDFDNDGLPEIYVQVNNVLKETILDRVGTPLYEGLNFLYWNNSTDNGGIVLADKDNNGMIETYHAGNFLQDSREYFNLREYDYENMQMIEIDADWKPLSPQPYSYDNPAAITDLDNNGKLDLVIAGLGITEYSTSGKVYWSQRYHDYQRTNSYNFVENYSVPPTPTASPTPTPTADPFDVNGDGELNILDFTVFKQSYLVRNDTIDFNGDRLVNVFDFNLFKKAYLSRGQEE